MIFNVITSLCIKVCGPEFELAQAVHAVKIKAMVVFIYLFIYLFMVYLRIYFCFMVY